MEYSIEINGIHCSGCINLIKLTLEEAGLENVEVTDKSTKFKTNKTETEIKDLLDKAFELDLQNYQYTNLNIIN